MSSKILAKLSKDIKDSAQEAGIVDLNQFRQIFQECDENKKGYIETNRDMNRLFQKLNFSVTLTNRRNVAKLFDPSGTGKIVESQFVNFFSPEVSSSRMNPIQKAIQILDPEGSKIITQENLEKLLGEGEFIEIAGRRVNKAEWISDFFDIFDSNHSGEVLVSEFISEYKRLADSIPDDDYWNKMMKASWTF